MQNSCPLSFTTPASTRVRAPSRARQAIVLFQPTPASTSIPTPSSVPTALLTLTRITFRDMLLLPRPSLSVSSSPNNPSTMDLARKYRSFASPVLPAPMGSGLCGAIANSAVPSKWSTPTTRFRLSTPPTDIFDKTDKNFLCFLFICWLCSHPLFSILASYTCSTTRHHRQPTTTYPLSHHRLRPAASPVDFDLRDDHPTISIPAASRTKICRLLRSVHIVPSICFFYPSTALVIRTSVILIPPTPALYPTLLHLIPHPLVHVCNALTPACLHMRFVP